MDTKDLFEFIRKVPLFSIYEDKVLAELIQLARLRSVSAGELVFDQGDEGDSFYIVYSGKIRILKKNEQGKEINLGVNTKGDHFGETALITENPRNAAARAVEDSVLICIDKSSFNDYLFARPESREYFDKFIRYTSINHFLKTCTNLGVVSPRDLQELLRKFDSEFYKEGDV
ncbi:MAG: cyclic nucleotide-binding domain-containing protein, partial [Deltaproteobacteria bacterium]|nr:cyclic nucleotide-binding domain-containing protein [Deltaproteobacteria bacterium]